MLGSADRMRHILITALLISVFSSSLFAGTSGKIAGLVKDAATGEVLPGANVLLQNTYLGASTDLDGYYVILNVQPGSYRLEVSMIGYRTKIFQDVIVRIDQTTTIDVSLASEALEIDEAILVVADRPVVERDVAASRANLNFEEIKSLPVSNVAAVVGLQAGIEGSSIRGGQSDEVTYMVNGLSLRDERNNRPFTGISYTAVEEIQVQAGGFNAEFGNIRSGIVNVVTKEGDRSHYNFALITKYRAAAPKHFGISPNSPDAYWIRPYIDDDVCWVGTENGTWDEATQKQYPEFEGFNEISRTTLLDDNPDNDLTPEAAQQLFLWEHRRQLDISNPDYDLDMSFGGPVPLLSQKLGNLRFFTSYKQTQTEYLIPLSTSGVNDYTWQMKLTSDVAPGKKLMVEGMLARQTGTNSSGSGNSGLFSSSSEIADQFYNFSYGQGATFMTDYWSPSTIDYNSLGLKFTNSISPYTFYEASIHRFASRYDTHPGDQRDTSRVYLFGNNYYVDESPYNWEYNNIQSLTGMRMGAPSSSSQDSSKVSSYTFKFDITSQINRFNNIKSGAEFIYTNSDVNYARRSIFVENDLVTTWQKYPVRGAVYVQDKLEFEGMIAQLGLRMDYSHAGGEWYTNFDPYAEAFSAKASAGMDTLLKKESTPHVITFSPRLAIAFPISVNSKMYFNYGHFRQLPQPENLYLIRSRPNGQVQYLSDPGNDLPRTVAYELGYEHNLFDQYLIRTSAYYKDISFETRSVTYQSYDASVNYARSTPDLYRDIRGFEFTLKKDRGDWVRGFVNYTYMVSSSGYFNYALSYQNPATQRDYERTTREHEQSKPLPRPYGRASLDFFTPVQFGPDLAGLYPLEDWRVNFLGSWKAGSFTTWTGSITAPGVYSNLQWRDNWNLDLRLSKDFKYGRSRMQFFVDVSNVLNIKRLSSYGFVDPKDRTAYYESLHYSSKTDGYEYFDYSNIPGTDRPGDYRKTGAKFIPITAKKTYLSISDPNANDLYYFADPVEGVHGKGYYRWVDNGAGGSWIREDQSRIDRILADKAYIDMPNLTYFSFLSPRNIFWGIKLTLEL